MVDKPIGHTPVLPREVCELLAVQSSDTVVDATVGLGGHARLFAENLDRRGTLICLDVDPANLERARANLAGRSCRIEFIHAKFAELPKALGSIGLDRVDVLLADLGVSSTQLDDGARGFSFMHDGPLDMRMDPRLMVTAADMVNRMKERDLADVLFYNAQEMRSRRISKLICNERRNSRITTTGRLAEIVARAQGINPSSHKAKIHPATRTFMALRMAVNEEIPNLERLLQDAPAVLKPAGRFGVIAFHSVEDKVVKLDFRKRKSEIVYNVLTKKPVTADDEERRANPRSRSAKLRVARRLPTE